MIYDSYIAKQLLSVYLQIDQFFFSVDSDWVEENVPESCQSIVELANEMYEKIVGTKNEADYSISDIIIPFEVIVRMTKDITVIDWFGEQKEKESENGFYYVRKQL